MRIQHNIPAMSAYRNYTNNTSSLAKNLEKLSSGYKINRAGDDAAGLAISEKMRAQITGLQTAQKNAKDGISLVQTAEGALTEVHDMLNRMVTLTEQSANGTYDDSVDRYQLQKEIDSLKSEINRIADGSNFNGIKLLDGSLSTRNLTVDSVEYASKSITDGLTINEGQNGGGSKGEYTIDVKAMYGTGDTLTFDFDGTGSPTDKTLTFGTDFSGTTLEEQAKSIAEALNGTADIAQKFDITSDGTTVKLVSKEEGSTTPTLKDVKTVDKSVVFGTGVYTAGTKAASNPAKLEKAGFTKLFDGSDPTKSLDLKAGDVLEFKFNDAQGNQTLTAKVTVTADMLGGTNEATTQAIVDALNGTKFEDDASTAAADESRFTVGDLFTVSANKKTSDGSTEIGSIKIDAKLDGEFGVASVGRTNPDDSGRNTSFNAETTGVQAGTANVASKYQVTGGSNNFSYGDTIEMSGTLSDGRTFNIKLKAGEDFEIGTTYQNSMNNMKALLEKNGTAADAIDVTLGDGSKVKAGDIFGAGKEITITTAADGFTFESVRKGPATAGVGSAITAVSLSAAARADAKATLVKGTDPSAATSSFTFDNSVGKGLGYGTAIKVDGKTYELVKDIRDVSNRSNIAVVVGDLTDTDGVASAFANAINGQAPMDTLPNGTQVPRYTATTDGSTVTLTTAAVGSDVKAMAVTTPYGREIPTLKFKLDPSKIKAGSSITLNDGENSTTYEFVKTGEKPTKEGSIAIEIDDFDKMPDAKALGDALANVAKGATVDVADDGTVTITANEVKGSIPKMTASFSDGKGGLTLQIGDTSEDFNQLNVSVYDCHTDAMGIEDIDISTQPGATAALEKIKSAINYVSDVRGTLGATQNRLDHTINNLSVMTQNIQDAESSIRDVDVAEEMMEYTKNNILVQSAQAMLAQANQMPQGVLQLLQ